MNPRIIRIHDEADKEKLKQKDELMSMMSQYMVRAVIDGIGTAFNGRKHQMILDGKPLFRRSIDEIGLSEEEIMEIRMKEAIAVQDAWAESVSRNSKRPASDGPSENK